MLHGSTSMSSALTEALALRSPCLPATSAWRHSAEGFRCRVGVLVSGAAADGIRGTRSSDGRLFQADREAGAEVRAIRLALEQPSPGAGVETPAQEVVLSEELRPI